VSQVDKPVSAYYTLIMNPSRARKISSLLLVVYAIGLLHIGPRLYIKHLGSGLANAHLTFCAGVDNGTHFPLAYFDSCAIRVFGSRRAILYPTPFILRVFDRLTLPQIVRDVSYHAFNFFTSYSRRGPPDFCLKSSTDL
jgi:hypothetical protein